MSDKLIPTYKNDGENVFSVSILDFVDQNDELDNLKCRGLREKYPGNEFFLEYINKTLMYTPAMLIQNTWVKGEDTIEHKDYIYRYVIELVYNSNREFRTYYHSIYDRIINIEQIDRLY